MQSRIEHALEVFGDVLMWLGGIAITLMMLQIGADVVSKYLFNAPIIATLEIVTWYYMVATVFLPVVYIQVHKKHLMVELFTMNWPPRRMAKLEGIVGVVGFVYVGTLAYLTGDYALHQTLAELDRISLGLADHPEPSARELAGLVWRLHCSLSPLLQAQPSAKVLMTF